jgi:hypothetical protein
MGSRGLDLALWLFTGAVGVYVIGLFRGHSMKVLFYIVLLLGIFTLYCCLYQIISKSKSRKAGLTNVVLLPVWPWWVKLLVRMSGGRVKGVFRRAFEVHIETSKGIEAERFIQLLDRDLKLAEKKYPDTLFMWETTAPLPSRYRKLARSNFWEEGTWKIPWPEFPFIRVVNRRRKKKVKFRHGYIIIHPLTNSEGRS